MRSSPASIAQSLARDRFTDYAGQKLAEIESSETVVLRGHAWTAIKAGIDDADASDLPSTVRHAAVRVAQAIADQSNDLGDAETELEAAIRATVADRTSADFHSAANETFGAELDSLG